MKKYCNCLTPIPEEVKNGCLVCLECELPILQSEDAPEPDIDEHEDYEEQCAIEGEAKTQREEAISLNHYE